MAIKLLKLLEAGDYPVRGSGESFQPSSRDVGRFGEMWVMGMQRKVVPAVYCSFSAGFAVQLMYYRRLQHCVPCLSPDWERRCRWIHRRCYA